MKIEYIKFIECAVVITCYIVTRIAFNKLIDKTMTDKFIQKSRGDFMKRIINFALLSIFLTIILLIWGVNQSDLLVFVGSVLTVIGVAMFAQWSILSNITSSIIIFFNHPVKLDDSIVIMEGKDYEIEGKVTNIGIFFITIEKETSEEITLPNNIFLQKMIRKKIDS